MILMSARLPLDSSRSGCYTNPERDRYFRPQEGGNCYACNKNQAAYRQIAYASDLLTVCHPYLYQA